MVEVEAEAAVLQHLDAFLFFPPASKTMGFPLLLLLAK